MKTAYVAYNKRSATTGKLLAEALAAKKIGGLSWRRCMDSNPKVAPDLFLRWGNSLTATPRGAKELNTREAVQMASNKLRMAEVLSNTNEVRFPRVIFLMGHGPALPAGNWFVRNQHDQIRYRNRVEAGDKYAVEEIEKVREFRVHVFNDKIIGIYEKVPQRSGDKILKAENCDFRRLDREDKSQMERIKGVRPMARAAVKALGLLYGGVDVIMDRNNNPYVLEVNSSPALNGPNIERWVEAIAEYLGSPTPVQSAVPVAEGADRRQREAAQRQEEQRQQQRVADRQNAWNNTRQDLERIAREAGFTITLQRTADAQGLI